MNSRRLGKLGCAAITFAAALSGNGPAVVQAGPDPAAPASTEAFDAAPFGLPLPDPTGKSVGLEWTEPRKVRQLLVDFPADAKLPDPQTVRVEYWHRVWDGRPDPVLAETGACGYGWVAQDDLTNGAWKPADAKVQVDGRRWAFAFAPTGATEFPDLKSPGVGYRKTLKIRLACDQPLPPVARLQALTDAVYRPLSVRIFFGLPANPGIRLGDAAENGFMEVYNGAVVALRPLADSKTMIEDGTHWRLPAGAAGGIEADLRMAFDPNDARYDRTIVTVRSPYRPFSFAADEVARGDRILIDDLGVLVVRGDEPISLTEYRQARSEQSGKTVYARIFDESEQTLTRAWNDMPLKRPLFFVHGLPANRNSMRQEPNGGITINGDQLWFAHPPSAKDTDRKLWEGGWLTLRFGFPSDPQRGGRELRDGYLPLVRTWWQDGPVYYEQTTILDKLSGDLDDIRLDDPTVLLMRVRVINTSDHAPATARLRVTSHPRDRADELLTLADDRVCAATADGPRVRCLFRASRAGQVGAADGAVTWSVELGPGQTQELFAIVPSITANEAELETLRGRNFRADAQRISDFWRQRTAGGTRLTTPEPWLNDFYKAHARHLLVNCFGELDTDRLHAHVGSFVYGDFPNESIMMISDLDRRGYHREAERCLESYLHYQGTVPLPGNFTGAEGLFYGSGGHEMGGYNKSHGYVCWGMANHWWTTRDRAWMERAAPKLVQACEWIIRQRRATMTPEAQGARPIEYGFLPAGGLEDVQDYWYWLATNAATVWGFDALADALADFGHPRAAELQREARAFHDDLMRGLTESRIRTPVVRLRDGTYVPKFPSHLHLRGRSTGWIRETLEGPMFLLHYGLIGPDQPEAKWVLEDYEDNLYISDRYGYSIPAFDTWWFSRGGFSMQANLLDGPPPYLYRDEVKHYLRAFFNGFASAFYPEIRMCNEHSAPELGYPAGDHFKSSDEAQCTFWLRLMFVREAGRDLYVGQAIPRYWMANGNTVGIEEAATYFGPMSFRATSHAAAGTLEAVLTPPTRNPPETVYVRLCHPEGKPIRGVTVNGQPYNRFDAAKEWIVLPGKLDGEQTIVTQY